MRARMKLPDPSKIERHYSVDKGSQLYAQVKRAMEYGDFSYLEGELSGEDVAHQLRVLACLYDVYQGPGGWGGAVAGNLGSWIALEQLERGARFGAETYLLTQKQIKRVVKDVAGCVAYYCDLRRKGQI